VYQFLNAVMMRRIEVRCFVVTTSECRGCADLIGAEAGAGFSFGAMLGANPSRVNAASSGASSMAALRLSHSLRSSFLHEGESGFEVHR